MASSSTDRPAAAAAAAPHLPDDDIITPLADFHTPARIASSIGRSSSFKGTVYSRLDNLDGEPEWLGSLSYDDARSNLADTLYDQDSRSQAVSPLTPTTSDAGSHAIFIAEALPPPSLVHGPPRLIHKNVSRVPVGSKTPPPLLTTPSPPPMVAEAPAALTPAALTPAALASAPPPPPPPPPAPPVGPSGPEPEPRHSVDLHDYGPTEYQPLYGYGGPPTGNEPRRLNSSRRFGRQRSQESLNEMLLADHPAMRPHPVRRETDMSVKSEMALQGSGTSYPPPPHMQRSIKDHHQGHSIWIAISIIIISIFSTVFSGIFLGISIRAPRYGSWIGPNGALSLATAVILTSVFAKLVELSFVTAIVAFLGQVLSRRAIRQGAAQGVTLAEMTMRSWIMQPGTLVTHWEGVRYAGLTLLGALSLLSAIMATLYTSAATALVQPRLDFGNWQSQVLAGTVKAKFANPNFLREQCQTPIPGGSDLEGNTCLQIQYAAQGYHNYQQYLAGWEGVANSGNGTTELKDRPKATAMMYDNTTVTGPWIDIVSVPEASKKYDNRVVNNVTLAMPHAGVISAARDGRNKIIQPEELDGLGIYTLQASVVSPALNVLCVNLNRQELAPLIWESWPEGRRATAVNGTLTLEMYANAKTRTTFNKTVVDSLFNWGNQSEGLQPRPVFAKFPIEYNTIMNHTGQYGRDSVYLLGRSPEELGEIYNLCALKAFQTSDCSTRYNTSQSGSHLEAVCNSPPDPMAYSTRHPDSASKGSIVDLDWPNIGSEAANSWSLNTGIVDGNSSNCRLITQLIIKNSTEPDLNPALPSTAEALAIMFSSTLLMSTISTPYVPGSWNYTGASPLLGPPYATQYFDASVLSQEYSSGPHDSSSRGWYLPIFCIFIINVCILIYFAVHRGTLVTDFSEPPNLFSLAVNSTPRVELQGTSAGVPRGKHYNVPWRVEKEGEQLVLEPHSYSSSEMGGGANPHRSLGSGIQGFRNSMMRMRPNSMRLRTPVPMLDGENATNKAKYSERRSWLW